MPHQCVRCNAFYDDGAAEILKGCKCGARLFFYVKKEALEKIKQATVNLSDTEKKQIEHDVLELIGADEEHDEPVVLDFESIRCLQPGKFELDLVKIFKKDPLVYKLGDGKYFIDLPQTFKKTLDSSKKRKSKKK